LISISLCFLLRYLFFYCSPSPPPLHSFPTRRSSDLSILRGVSPISSSYASRSCLVHSTARAVRNAFSRSVSPRIHAGQTWVQYRSEEHTSELQSRFDLVCRLLLEKKKHSKANNRQPH